MPFTQAEFLEVFRRYNELVAPAQWLLLGAACIAATGAWRGGADRTVAAILAALWAWIALAYHVAFFTSINPAAWIFAALSMAGAAAFAWHGAWRGRLRFGGAITSRRAVGLGLVATALLLYPAASLLAGHRYPASPTFGLPCPTTLFTLGILLLATPPVPAAVWILPVAWAVVGSVGALALGMPEDLMLLAALLAAALGAARSGPSANAPA